MDQEYTLNNDRRNYKILCISSFSFINLFLLIILMTPHANAYEISIYEIYPWYFWFFVIAALFTGEIMLFKIAMSKESNNLWFLGFIAILLTDITLLFMPIIRGYITDGRGDVLTHIGFIKNIMSSGIISDTNFYPLDHILASSLSLITKINVLKVVLIIPPLFSVFYVCSMYLLGKNLFIKKNEIFFLLLFSTILLFSNGNLIFAPSHQAFFCIPFVLYLYFKSRTNKLSTTFSILLVIYLFFIVYFHPEVTFFLIVIFLFIDLSMITCNIIYKNEPLSLYFKRRNTLNIIFICFITFCSWYFSYSFILGTFSKAIKWIIYGSDSSQYQFYSDLVVTQKPDIPTLFFYTLNTYGQSLILGMMGLFFSTRFLIIYLQKKNETPSSNYHLFSSIGLLMFVLISFLTFVGDFTIGFERTFKYVLFFSSIVSGLGIYSVFYENEGFIPVNLFKFKFSFNSKVLKIFSVLSTFLLLTTLLFLLYFSIFNLYFSPNIKSINSQVSETEIDGYSWFLHHRNEELIIKELGTDQVRFSDLTFGAFVNRDNLSFGEIAVIPYHFGYDNTSFTGALYTESTYLIFPIQAKIMYQNLFPEYYDKWRLYPNDFDRFENDPTSLKIYNSVGFNVYQVIPFK